MLSITNKIIAAPAAGLPPASQPTAGQKAGKTVNGRTRVLVVEDDYLVASGIEAGLIDAGFEVIGIAMSAEEAIRLAKQERPDIAIMDIRLSGKRDGVDAALEIRKITGIRCIFATAHDDPQTRARAEPASPIGWLPKPYAVESVVSMVKSALSEIKKRK